MRLRRFTSDGLNEFNNYLDLLEEDGALVPPMNILSDNKYSEDLNFEIEIENKAFATRYDVAEYFFEIFSGIGIQNLEKDIFIWSWCSLYFFEVLCPSDNEGFKFPRERSAYVPEPENYRRYYRHLLLGPFLIYRAHKDNPARALALLCKPPHIISDVEAQIAAYQELVTNRAIVELATKLYYDPKSKTTKKGAASKGIGSARRLVAVLNQFDLTWDLYATTTIVLQKMLPKEFGKFAKNNG